jgi:hypothetical protein
MAMPGQRNLLGPMGYWITLQALPKGKLSDCLMYYSSTPGSVVHSEKHLVRASTASLNAEEACPVTKDLEIAV